MLTDYFSIVTEIGEAVCNNPSLSGLIKENCHNSNTIEFSTPVLQQLFTNAHKNSQHLPKGRRHNEIMKKFSMSLLFMAGPSAYELLHQNMPEALPSLPN